MRQQPFITIALLLLIIELSVRWVWQRAVDESAPASTQAAAQAQPPVGRDASAALGRRAYRRIMADIIAGVMTDSEIRAGVQNLRSRYTSVTDNMTIRSTVDELLRALTQGQAAEAVAASDRLIAACAGIIEMTPRVNSSWALLRDAHRAIMPA